MPGKLKIIYVLQSLVKGGAERLILEISNELQRKGLAEILIIAPGPENHYPGLSASLDVRVCPVRFNLSVFGKNEIDISGLTRMIGDFKPDIIHTNCYMQEAPPREIIHAGTSYFTHLHDNMPAFENLRPGTFFSKKALTSWYEKRRLIGRYRASGNNFIAISKDTYDYFSTRLPADLVKNMVLLPNAIDYKKFYFPAPRRIDKGSLVRLANIGNFLPRKNQFFLLPVVRMLKEKGINVLLTFIGNTMDKLLEMAAEIDKYGLQDNIKFSGMVEDVEEHLKATDIYVHSADYEPFGLVLLEAMASGLPVVCLDGKGNRDILEEGKNGFMIHDPDPGLFTEKIMELIEKPELYSQMSEHARKYAGQFDIAPYCERLIELYLKSLPRNRQIAFAGQ